MWTGAILKPQAGAVLVDEGSIRDASARGMLRGARFGRARHLYCPYWMPTTMSRSNVTVMVAAAPVTASSGLAAVIR